MTNKNYIEQWMNHPEAVAETFKEMQIYIDRLLAERDQALELFSRGCFSHLDNGTEYSVSGYAGGGSEGGILSYVTISWTDVEQNKTWCRKYEPVDDWILISSSETPQD